MGDGGVYVDLTSDDPKKRPSAPTILERREGERSTIFGNVLDLTGKPEGYVKSVAQSGEVDAGFAALRIETAEGRDLCFASYRRGDFVEDGIETDALQAFVSSNRSGPRALYLGGGTYLKAGDASVKRSETGLAYVEKLPNDSYTVGNPSPGPATVTVRFEALRGLEALCSTTRASRKARPRSPRTAPGSYLSGWNRARASASTRPARSSPRLAPTMRIMRGYESL